MGRVVAICISETRGTRKQCRDEAMFVAGSGLEGDAHAGDWHRQVSLLGLEQIEDFRRSGAEVTFGDFGENLVVAGVELAALAVGDELRVGDATLKLTQFGKECHNRCHIYESMGDCIMPRQGVFAKVLRGGRVRVGDAVEAAGVDTQALRAALVTVSDKGAAGQREDASGDAACDLLRGSGLTVAVRHIIPDEREAIEDVLLQLCDEDDMALVLTTGGTGFSPRDVTPEATLAVADKLCPGIPETMRALSLAVTRRAMLSRAVAVIRGKTLIVNLPGSPRAVRECLGFVLEELRHGLAVLRGSADECGQP